MPAGISLFPFRVSHIPKMFSSGRCPETAPRRNTFGKHAEFHYKYSGVRNSDFPFAALQPRRKIAKPAENRPVKNNANTGPCIYFKCKTSTDP